ncbi:imidazole glycerol phosphate synthase subunit HisH [Paramagnetospirillum kuznetsovii]|uniref:Imidazole glycerol phosphate synthase subunit HisH n=1 Tax=Paramagnetospirillum kuznetsovii TaxID=2053833 RepID=A0A364P2K7_9PROT|nr:imidazole glycerol phosphate synthase subunit HisH [Paramagnetospirillum kuznetsovii]RAU23563.1 imidazole glycerol phosphate synthase subunit HisH [Paramagnetospirillum kuznetsovii]
MTVNVTVVDYGVGNLLSVTRALAHVGAAPVLSSDPAVILASEFLVLPGVGAFGAAMMELERRGLTGALRERGRCGRPFLGICLGAQLLLDGSDEFGSHDGLGLISGRVQAVPSTGGDGRTHRIPHIGWADLAEPAPGRWQGTIFQDTRPGTSVYFVHSFHAMPTDPAHLLAVVDYDGIPVTAAIGHGAVTGCQFHPEKSGEAGLRMLHRFAGLGD